jgi:putative cardiolipin synthase
MTVASKVPSLLLFALAGCASLPSEVERPPSSALVDTGDTRLGRALAPAVAANTGMTAVHPLDEARNAFAARVLLARTASRYRAASGRS